MKRPNERLYEELSRPTAKPCLSAYIKIQTDFGTANSPNLIELNNAIRDIEKLISKEGLNKTERDAMLEPFFNLRNNPNFHNQVDGTVAIFANRRNYAVIRLKNSFDSSIELSDSFRLDHLKQELSNNKEFLLLNVSLHGNDLFRGDMYELEVLPVERLSLDLTEALALDEIQKQLQTHSVGRGRQGKTTQAPHGHGEPDSSKEELTEAYLRHIESIVSPIAKKYNLPLVFAGLREYFPTYKRINKYDKLVDSPVRVNMRHDGLRKLHRKAWGTVAQLGAVKS